MKAEDPLSNPQYKTINTMKLFIVRIEHRKSQSIGKKKYQRQEKYKENCIDDIRIYSVRIVRIHK
jgi:stalled ribosome alternative rescue factor ArfA